MTKLCVFLLSMFLYFFTSYATTIHVPGDQPTIQAGIDAATDGDTVLVADGTYTGTGNKDIDFTGKAIVVISENGPDSCVVDCENFGRGFIFQSNEDTNSILKGLKIINGWKLSWPDCHGGGIKCYFSSPVIKNCIIFNSESSYGGGIYCNNSNPTIDSCQISENSTVYYGGGICCDSSASPTIIECIINNNVAGWCGGGVRCFYFSNPFIENCTIEGNTSGSYGGGGIHCENYSSPIIQNCSIDYNSTEGSGGGINCSGNSNAIISNCNITWNTTNLVQARQGGGINCCGFSDPIISYSHIKNNFAWRGGGIYCDHSDPIIDHCVISGHSGGTYGGGIEFYYSMATLVNCTICDNSSFLAGGICNYYNILPNVTNCIIWDNSPSQVEGNFTITYSDIMDGWTGTGNINSDPLFYSLTGDSAYYLTAGSPCIDAGDPNSPPDPDSTIADIGAFWYPGPSQPSPHIAISAIALNFGQVALWNISEMELIIYNEGNATLELYDAYTSSEVFYTDFNPGTIEPGDSVILTVYFEPEEITTYYENLTIENNDETAIVSLQGEGIGTVAVILIPYNPPIQIPANGGTFDFNIAVENLGTSIITADIWTMATLPNGNEYGPIIGPVNFTLNPGYSGNRDRTQNVPANAPSGLYTYDAYIGTYPDSILDEDHFDFEKLSTDNGSGYIYDWNSWGEGFEGETVESYIPSETVMNSPYPNPFNPVTILSFDIAKPGNISLVIYDIQGREVAHMIDGFQPAGIYEVSFNASELSSGVYFARLNAGDFHKTQKLLLIK